MGNPNTKLMNTKDDIATDKGSLPSTPILTPKTNIIDNDPRSPSANIVRTPIQSINFNHSGTPIVGVINTTECEDSTVNIDPRSPSVEFTRTPIVAANSTIKLRNKNLDSVKQQLMNFSPVKQNDSKEESPNKTVNGPKFLGFSPIIKKIDQSEKRKSYLGLLETNLDFVETDIDKAAKSASVSLDCHQIFEQETNEQSETKEEEKEVEDSISKQEQEIISDKEAFISPIKQTLEKISLIDKEIIEVITIANDPIIELDGEIQSNEFDKKVTNLIYEDDEIVTVISKSIRQNSEKRTPLSDKNIINQNSRKSLNKLRVHDKPQKKDYTVSKIPVFKEKRGKSKFIPQCENTPPRQKPDGKPRKMQWDGDKTLII